jgi:GNAT superfamily N-acetyltransferase
MIIRSATLADLPRFQPLLQQAIAFQQQLNSGFDLAPGIDWERVLTLELNNPQEHVWLAEQNKDLVGFIHIRMPIPHRRSLRHALRRLLSTQTTVSLVQPRSVGWIEDCYVLPFMRRQGFGHALVQTALRWFEEHHIKQVELALWVANEDGRAFWERQGFSPVRLQMSKEIGLHPERD